jgi:hypothetical protein
MEDTETAVQIWTGNISKHSEGKQMDDVDFVQRETTHTEDIYDRGGQTAARKPHAACGNMLAELLFALQFI